MKLQQIHLGFIGFGHMARVLCKAIELAHLIPRSQIAFIQRDPAKMKKNEQEFGITSTSLKTLLAKSDLILLAVRPNQMEMVAKEIAELGGLPDGKMIVTILAGLKLAYYQTHFGQTPVLRLMPNVAAAVGEGMTLLSYSQTASREFKSLTHMLFASIGQILEIKEELMDAASAMSGCGPAFVFRLIEAMARFGEKEGLAYEDALKMASQTFLGAAKMLMHEGRPEKLIQEIAVPNGMTEAGLKVMTERRMDDHFQEAIQAAQRRSMELGR